MKQALVEQGRYREQESSHLEWPDHTPCSVSPVPLLTKPSTAPAGKRERFTGSNSNITKQRRGDLKLRDNKLITDTKLPLFSHLLCPAFFFF